MAQPVGKTFLHSHPRFRTTGRLIVLKSCLAATLAVGPSLDAHAGPLADGLSEMMQGYGGRVTWEAIDEQSETGSEEDLTNLVIDFPDGQRLIADRARLDGEVARPQLILADVMLTGSRGSGTARRVEISGEILRLLMEGYGTMTGGAGMPAEAKTPSAEDRLKEIGAASGSLIANGVRVSAARRDGGKAEALFADGVNIELAGNGVDRFAAEGLKSVAGTGESASIGRVDVSLELGNLAEFVSVAGTSGDIGKAFFALMGADSPPHHHVRLEQLLLSDSAHEPVLSIGAVTMSQTMAEHTGDPADDAAFPNRDLETPEAQGLAAYNFVSRLDARMTVSFADLWFPVSRAPDGAWTAAAKASKLSAISGHGTFGAGVKDGKGAIAGSMDLEGVADFELNLRLALPEVEASRIAAIEDGSPAQISDIPSMAIEYFSASYADQGANAVAGFMGFGSTGEAISKAAAEFAESALKMPVVTQQMQPLAKGLGAWIDNGREGKICVKTKKSGDGSEVPTIVEIGVVGALSPDLAVDRLGLSRVPCD